MDPKLEEWLERVGLKGQKLRVEIVGRNSPRYILDGEEITAEQMEALCNRKYKINGQEVSREEYINAQARRKDSKDLPF